MDSPLHGARRRARRAARALLLPLQFIALAVALNAQDPPDSTRPMYGVPDTEFLRGIWIGPDENRYAIDPTTTAVTYDATPSSSLWDYAASIGVNTLRVSAHRWGGYPLVQDLLDEIPPGSDTQRVILSHMGTDHDSLGLGHEFNYFDVGFSQNVEFFPFDSVRFDSWRNRFLTIDGGFVRANPSVRNDHGTGAGERVMSTTNGDTAGQLIAARIAYNWMPWQTRRFESSGAGELWHDSTAQNADYPLRYKRGMFPFDFEGDNGWVSDWYVAVKGHLFDNPEGDTAQAGDALLRIVVWQEVPRNWWYRANGVDVQATDTLSRPVDTILVLKASLVPTPDDPDDFDAYREVSFAVPVTNFISRRSAITDTNSLRFDFRVFWTGAEQVALRSISFRDPVAELMLGNTAQSDTFRAQIVRHVRAIANDDAGTPNDLTDDVLRSSVIGVGAGGEYYPTEIDAMRAFNRLMKQNFGTSTNIAFRLPAYGEDGDMENLHHIDSLHEVFTQEYQLHGVLYFGEIFGNVSGVPPAIIEHNANRFGLKVGPTTVVPSMIPELVLPSNSYNQCRTNINSFERSLQRIGFGGQYIPSYRSAPEPVVPVARGPYPSGRSQLTALGRMAEDARDRHRRLILVLFNTADVSVSPVQHDSNWYLDTNVWRIPEASELRAMTNMGLAYGAKGLVHQVSGSQLNILREDSASGLWSGRADSWGIVGPGTGDSTRNRFDALPLYQWTNVLPYYGEQRVTIPNFYVGWQNRSAETRRINAWIKRVGPHLMRLRWRDGYSVHFTVQQKYALRNLPNEPQSSTPRFDSLGWRPIDMDEPITQVRTRDPRKPVTPGIGGSGYLLDRTGTGVLPVWTNLDSLDETYVELGFFYPKRGLNPKTNQPDPVYDTTYAFVVNRRCFERPEDVAPTSARGILMDSLAEMREVWMKLRMPVSAQHTFVRIREIAADSTVVPGRVTRRALDTIVSSHAWFKINLGPGRGALLQMTPLPPDESIITGMLPYNSQRKIVFDGRRYHAVYTRTEDTLVPPHQVYYRRSLPVGDSTGSILWEPRDAGGNAELRVSYVPTDTLWENDHPSITVRRLLNAVTGLYDTVATIVWTCHSWAHAPVGNRLRQVALRNVYSSGDELPAFLQDSIEWVTYRYDGTFGSRYGTPVICRAHDGEFIAWSDSSRGIGARYRRYGTGEQWWNAALAYTDSMYVGTRGALFPTLPTFAHVANAENTTGLAWQQAESFQGNYAGTGTPSSIRYRRLYYDSTLMGVIGHWLTSGNPLIVTPNRGLHYHPSMDLHQDRWGETQDCITWESVEGRSIPSTTTIERVGQIQFRSVYTQPNRGASKLWGWAQLFDRPFDTVSFYGRDTTYRSANLHPNASSLSQYFSPTQSAPATTTIAWNSLKPNGIWEMLEAAIQWADVRFRARRKYTWGGRYLSGSTAMAPHQNRHVVLYSDGGDTLRTTREYYLARRARPVGYLAQGRQVILRFNDSSGLVLGIEDPWYAGFTSTAPVTYAARSTPDALINSLGLVTSLLRSESFSGADTTRIGAVSYATFFGDTTGLASMRVSLSVGLFDSTSNTVIHRLDSVAITVGNPFHSRRIDTLLVLMTGRYRIVASIDTSGVTLLSDTLESAYPVADVALQIEDTTQLGKLRRTDGSTGLRSRLAAYPNPAAASTELRFTLAESNFVTVTIVDQSGAVVAFPLRRQWVEAGRYGLDLDVRSLPIGTYLVALTTTRSQLVERLVIGR